jgi:hypothetical protein
MVSRLASVLIFFLLQGVARAQEEPPIESWFPKLRTGMWIEVDGALTPDRVLEATVIKLLDGELDEWQIETNVLSVDTKRRTIMSTFGMLFVSTSKTVLKGPKKGAIDFSFFGVDDRIEVEGRLQKDGSLLADELEVEKSKKLKPDLVPKNHHQLRTRIESVDAEKLQITTMGIKVQLSAQTRNKTAIE